MIASSGQVLQQGVALIVYVGARAIIAGELSIGALIAATILAARARPHAPGGRRLAAAADGARRIRPPRRAAERADRARRPRPRPAGARPCRVRGRGLPLRRRCRAGARRHRSGNRAGAGARHRRAAGSGKSTFTKLLCGLDQPERGRILLDDLDLRLWSPAVLRQQIGVVPQEVQLFSGTIAENIALGAVDRQFERVVAAAKFVGAHDFIQRLPAGYDTRSASAAAACPPASAS